MSKNANKAPISFLFMRKDFHQEDGHSSDLDQKRSGILLHDSKPQGECDKVAELMMIKFGESGHPVFRATSPLSRRTLKSKGGGKLSIHLTVPMGIRLKLFFAQLNQLSIFGAVSGFRDPLNSSKFVSSKTLSTEVLCRQEHCCKSTKNEWKDSHNKIRVIKICTDAGFLTTVDVWTVLHSWQKTLKNSHNLQSQWLVVSTLCQEMKNHLTRKVGFEGTPKLGPYWKSQPGTYKVNMEWKLELNL